MEAKLNTDLAWVSLHGLSTSCPPSVCYYSINKKMIEIMTWEAQTNDLKEVVNKLIPDSTGKDIEKACPSIYPLHDVFVRKVKMLKNSRFELGKLMENPRWMQEFWKMSRGWNRCWSWTGWWIWPTSPRICLKIKTFNGAKTSYLLFLKKRIMYSLKNIFKI